MKPRIVFATSSLRLVRHPGRFYDSFTLEQTDGHDAMGRTRWRAVLGDALKNSAESFVRELGRSLVRREKQRRRARR